MRVLHLSSERTWRGGEQQIAYLMGVLRSHGVENVLVARAGSEMAQRYPDALTIPFRGEWDLLSVLKLKKIIKDEKIDLIHAHSGHGHTMAVLASGGLPVIVSKRTDYPVKDHFFSKWKFNHSSIKRFLCVSDKIREILSRDLIEPAKAVTVYSGIDMARFPQVPKSNIRQLAGLPSDTQVVVSTAAISPQKDYATFLQVAASTKVHHPNLHYVICGEGPSFEEIKSLQKKLGLESHVHFIGFRRDLTDFLGSADAFLITSKEEGLGTSILDAFAVGLPVVATAAGGIPEIVIHSETGLLAQVGDAQMLARHIENIVYAGGTLRERLVKQARLKAEEFSYQRTGNKTLEVYSAVLKG